MLLKAYKFYCEKINYYFENCKKEEKNAEKGEQIAKFLNDIIAEKLIFTQIIVEDELRTYTVFETLNSRGVGLTVTDLLKNYLFSLAASIDLPHIRGQWDRVVDSVGLDNFPTFLWHYWISKNPLIRQAYLYKIIRTKIQNSDDLFRLLEDLEKNVVLYVALSHDADELWKGNRELKKRIREIDLFQVKQCLPILMISHEKLPAIFDKIVKIITVISFRSTVVGGYHSGILEEIYNKAALKIANGEITTPQAIANEVKELYLSDIDFKNGFATKSINTRRNKKLARYILFELENQLNNNGTSYDFEENSATIEPILPENAIAEWEYYFPKNAINNYVFRIGNYALLEEGKNREIGNKLFEEKLLVYKTSGFKGTSGISAIEWNANSLDKRQTAVAKLAVAIWKLPYYI